MTEICVQVNDDIEKIVERITANGFRFTETYTNHDTYYTSLSIDELKNVSYYQLINSSVIIRNIIGDNCDKKNIVYKKKKFDNKGNVIEEIKTKLNIDNISNAKLIFESLGLYCWCDYANQNNEYKKDEITINIQHVDGLGNFIEIEEFNSIKDLTEIEKFQTLTNIINTFDLPIGTDYSCKKPYMFFKASGL